MPIGVFSIVPISISIAPPLVELSTSIPVEQLLIIKLNIKISFKFLSKNTLSKLFI
jgi:hypothetical protein